MSPTSDQQTIVVEKDRKIPLRDGVCVFANIFRPIDGNQRYLVIFTYGPYRKDMHFINFDPKTYSQSPIQNEYMVWETPDPQT